MPASPHRDYTNLAVTHHSHTGRMLPQPRPGTATVPTYAGATVTINVDVVAADDTHVCIRQHDETWGEWLAWVPRENVTPA